MAVQRLVLRLHKRLDCGLWRIEFPTHDILFNYLVVIQSRAATILKGVIVSITASGRIFQALVVISLNWQVLQRNTALIGRDLSCHLNIAI